MNGSFLIDTHVLLRIYNAHPDAFDSALAAQAMALDIPLVTWDTAFVQFAGLESIW